MSSTGPQSFSLECPCCGAELVIDPVSRTVLHHQARQAHAPITDLAAEAAKLKLAGMEREKIFARSLDAEKNRGERFDKKFDELLRRAKESPDPAERIKDVDL